MPGDSFRIPVEPGDAEAFTAARARVDRQALNRLLREREVGTGEKLAMEAVRREFENSPLLLDAPVHRIALAALWNAVGPPVSETSWTIWSSLQRTAGGASRTARWESFCAWQSSLLPEVHPKGEGLVYAPVSTRDGIRRGESVTTVSNLVLDCDGAGPWWELWSVVEDLGLSACLYHSGGYTPERPKWRAIIPLAEPFRVVGPEDRLAWRAAYSTARTAFGALGRLRGPGFDPATDTVSHAWFPGYRRAEFDPPRETIARPGATLRLDSLVSALPPATAWNHGRRAPSAGAEMPSLLELAFAEAGMLGRSLGDGRSAVLCPWNDAHSTPLEDGEEPSSSSVLFAATNDSNLGQFFCSHSSCGSFSVEAVLDALPAEAVTAARAKHVPRRPPPFTARLRPRPRGVPGRRHRLGR